jgi:hypothetical protein
MAFLFAGWDHLGNSVLLLNHTYPALQETYHRVEMTVVLQRQYAYYLSRVVANIILLVLMASGVTFLGNREADRLGFVQASFVGIVSWLFVLSAETPKLGYSTRLDSFINASFGAVFAQFFYHAFSWGYSKWLDRKFAVKAYRSDDEPSSEDDPESDESDEMEHLENDRRVKRAIGLPVSHAPTPAVRGNPLTAEEPKSITSPDGRNAGLPRAQRANSTGPRRGAPGIVLPTAPGIRPPIVVSTDSVEVEMAVGDGGVSPTGVPRPLPATSSAAGLEIYRSTAPSTAAIVAAKKARANSAGPAPRRTVARKALPESKPKRPRKKDWLHHRRSCGTWPCSYYGEWHLWKARRRLDCIATTSILVAYFIAVAIILGGGAALTRPPVPWER